MFSPAPAADASRLPLPVRLLAIALVTWIPFLVAVEASSGLARLLAYGVPAIALLLARVAVAGLAVAAGRALWTRQPSALQLARAWLVLDVIVSAITLATPFFPSNRLPGGRGREFVITLVVNGACFLYLSTSSRVRACWPQP